MQPALSDQELQDRITQAGWQLLNIYPKGDSTAVLITDGQRTIEKYGPTVEWALYHAVNYIMKQNTITGATKRSVYPSTTVEGDMPSKRVSIGHEDPNRNWESGEIDSNRPPIEPGSEEDRAKLNAHHVASQAEAIDTNWWKSSDPNVWKQAVMNALRTALLSPRKEFNWNVTHSQQIRDLPPEATAADMFRRLEFNRRRWNASRGFDPLSHARWAKQLQRLTKMVQTQFPGQYNADDAQGIALGIIGELTKSAEQAYLHQQRTNPAQYDPATQTWKKKKPTSLGLMSKAYDIVRDQLGLTMGDKKFTNDDGQLTAQQVSQNLQDLGLPTQLDLKSLVKEAALSYHPDNKEDYSSDDPDVVGNKEKNPGRYGAFVYNHLDAVESVGQNINEIAKAAHDDMEKDNGQGFVFRNTLLSMGLKGINPKVASYAWLLLAPKTSELGTIDTHMSRALSGSQDTNTFLPGINDQSAGKPRDYYGMERSLKAMRDAMGYHNLPLGQFQWMMWDKLRGTPSDHRAAAVLDNKLMHHSELEWPRMMTRRTDPEYHPEEWMLPAYDARTRAWNEYQREHGGVGGDVHPDPSNPVPYPQFDILQPAVRQNQMSVAASTKHEEESHDNMNWFDHGPVNHEEHKSPDTPAGVYPGTLWELWAPHGYDYSKHDDEHDRHHAQANVLTGLPLTTSGGQMAGIRAYYRGMSMDQLGVVLREVWDMDPAAVKRFAKAARNAYAAQQWRVGHEESPNFHFVYFQGRLNIQPWDTNTSYRTLIENLLREHGKNIADYNVDDNKIASGKVYKRDGGLNVELESLADNDVQNAALDAVHKWNESINTVGDIQPVADWTPTWQEA